MITAGHTVNVPIGIRFMKGKLFVVCLPLKCAYFTEPFFIDSLIKRFVVSRSQVRLPSEDELLVRPVHLDKTVKIELIPEKKFLEVYLERRPSAKLGLIFHMSRCGSTLASQMLASSKRFFVLSEPSVINTLLDPGLGISQVRRKYLVISCIHALALAAPERCKHVFVKLRSWNSLYLRQLLKWFPRVPWLFIHRHGLEVLQSVRENPPGWMRSRKMYSRFFKSFLRSSIRAIRVMSDDEYAARMLGAFCRVAVNTPSVHRRFVEYTKLKGFFPSILGDLFGVRLLESESRNIEAVSLLYSKGTSGKKVLFKPDSLTKRSQTSHSQRDLVNRFVEVERLKLCRS